MYNLIKLSKQYLWDIKSLQNNAICMAKRDMYMGNRNNIKYLNFKNSYLAEL